MICNERAQLYRDRSRRVLDAYHDLRQGLLGIGKSEYSRTLTQYYNECLENFCAYEKVEECAEKFDFYINEIRKRVLLPDYPLLKVVLSNMVWEAEVTGHCTDAIRFGRELIFVTKLEGRQAPIPRSFFVPLDAEISNSMEEACSPIGAVPGSIDK
jgi:hypothetical protein